MNIYTGPELGKTNANFAPLTPVSVLKRTERVYSDLPAQIHGRIRRNWGEVAERCKRLASALSQRGCEQGRYRRADRAQYTRGTGVLAGHSHAGGGTQCQ